MITLVDNTYTQYINNVHNLMRDSSQSINSYGRLLGVIDILIILNLVFYNESQK